MTLGPQHGIEHIDACILVAPVEATSSFLRGSVRGPEEISRELDLIEAFDPELGPARSISRTKYILPEVDRDLPGALDALAREADRWLRREVFVLTLGGEHTITFGPLAAVVERYGEVGLIQLDAHGDLRDCYEGRSVSHACVMRRVVSEHHVPLLGLGIRSVCEEEAVFLARHSTVTHLSSRVVISNREAVIDAIEQLPAEVYLSIDMDVFDPSVAPGVGTPEAGGLRWYDVADVIDIVASRRRIVAADVVELVPAVERDRTVRLAARVALRVLQRSV